MKNIEKKYYNKIIKRFRNVEFNGITNLLATLNPYDEYNVRFYKGAWYIDNETSGQGEQLKSWLLNGFSKVITLSDNKTLCLQIGGKIELIEKCSREILTGETKIRFQHRVLFKDSETCYCLLDELKELINELNKIK